MKKSFFQNNIYAGLFFGLVTPVLGYYIVHFLFDILVHFHLMDAVSESIMSRRERTISLIAICTLIIPFNYFSKKRYMKVVKGILIFTFLYAAYWIFQFKDTLFAF